jgi:hypothetical protein
VCTLEEADDESWNVTHPTTYPLFSPFLFDPFIWPGVGEKKERDRDRECQGELRSEAFFLLLWVQGFFPHMSEMISSMEEKILPVHLAGCCFPLHPLPPIMEYS